jgi:hypothetical protein
MRDRKYQTMRTRKWVREFVLLSLGALAGTGFIGISLYDIGYYWGFMFFGLIICFISALAVWEGYLRYLDRMEPGQEAPKMPGRFCAHFTGIIVLLLVWEGASFGLAYPQSHYYRVSITEDVDNNAEFVALERAERFGYSGILDWGRPEGGPEETARQPSHPEFIDTNVTGKYARMVWQFEERQERGSFTLFYEARVEAVHELNLSFDYVAPYFKAHSRFIPRDATFKTAVWNQTGNIFANWPGNSSLTVNIHFGYLVKMAMECHFEPARGERRWFIHNQFVLMESTGEIRCIVQSTAFPSW